jgi:hypothetical protein
VRRRIQHQQNSDLGWTQALMLPLGVLCIVAAASQRRSRSGSAVYQTRTRTGGDVDQGEASKSAEAQFKKLSGANGRVTGEPSNGRRERAEQTVSDMKPRAASRNQPEAHSGDWKTNDVKDGSGSRRRWQNRRYKKDFEQTDRFSLVISWSIRPEWLPASQMFWALTFWA